MFNNVRQRGFWTNGVLLVSSLSNTDLYWIVVIHDGISLTGAESL